MRIHFYDNVNRDIPENISNGTPAKMATLSPHHLAAQAMAECQERGTIADHVSFDVLEVKARRGNGIALEVQLRAAQWDRGRRTRNSGTQGATRSSTYFGGGNLAATFDEWGFFLAALYRLSTAPAQCVDEILVPGDTPMPVLSVSPGPGDFFVGSPSAPTYRGEADFHHQTGRTYDPTYPAEVESISDPVHGDWDSYPYRSGMAPMGRRGVGRINWHSYAPSLGAMYDPRDADWLRKFQNGEVL